MRRDRGFTYIESGAAIAIVLMMAMIALPNIVNKARDRDQRLFKDQIQTLVSQAKSRAIESGHTVGLKYDKTEKQLQAVEEDPNNTEQQRPPLPPITLPTGVETQQFMADQDESPPDGWRVPFFPDGTSAGGGVAFKADDQPFSLVIEKTNSEAKVVDGPLPDLSLESWPAGGYEKRS